MHILSLKTLSAFYCEFNDHSKGKYMKDIKYLIGNTIRYGSRKCLYEKP